MSESTSLSAPMHHQPSDVQSLAPVESNTVALAASAEAEIKARFLVARSSPRNVSMVQERLLSECSRSRFAEGARYRRPVGQKFNDATGKWEEQFAEGFSIRFAEAALRAMGNLSVRAAIVYEDATKLRLRTEASDLETNSHLFDEVEIPKTVLRRKPKKGQRVVGERANSNGERIYVCEATAEELQVTVAATTSKRLRTIILRLVPWDVLEECEDAIRATIAAAAKDDSANAKLVAGFARLSVTEANLDEFLTTQRGKPSRIREGISVDEREALVAIGTSIKEGHATWAAIMAEVRGDMDAGAETTSEVDKMRERVKAKVRGDKTAATDESA